MQILFVATAFGLMVFASYWFVSDLERRHLQRDVKSAISHTEANIIADLKEPETILAGFSETIRGLIIRGDSEKTIREYIHFLNNYMQDNEKNRLLGVMGFYGYFDVFGRRYFTEGMDWSPPQSYDLLTRPWYIAAVEANGDIGVTEPYRNLRVGDISVISFARRIFDDDGKALGIICLDIKLDRVNQHAINTQFAEKGYGFLLSESREIIAHPEPSVIGMQFRDVKSKIASYEDELIENGFVNEVISTDYRGIESIVFLERLRNGWYMGIVTPRDTYYQSTRSMALFLTVMGALLATGLIAILLVMFNELNRENEKSQTMAHWYNSILNAIPLPITVTDVETKWTFINTAVEKFLGITFEEAIGKPCNSFGANICDTPDCGIVCARRGLKQTYFSEGDSSYQVDVAILKDIKDETMGYIEIVQDITNLKQITKKQADAEAANAAKSAFLAKVSHEIRTPMNAILGITEIQLRNGSLPDETRNALDKIYNSGYMLLGIINDILDLSKIEAGKLELFPVEYDFPSLINDTVVLNIVRYESKPITFNLHVDENIPLMLYGDELRIKQILNNLLSNAFKYTASGVVSMTVSLEQSRRPEPGGVTLVFCISDTGQGMTPEQLDKLFDEYMRFNMETNRAIEGAGLGMSITKHLVRLMNGNIEVQSKQGKGSSFTVHLPQKIAGDLTGVIGKELAEKIGQMSPVKSAHKKKAPIIYEYMPYGKILVVDDVETNLYVTRGLISPYGLSVDTASSGYEVIKKVKSGIMWDIIFMDHFMPGMDGVETARIIRGMGYIKPIVALTANVVSGQAEMFFANGFDDFISKPIDIRQLDIILNKHIRDKYPDEIIKIARQLKNSMGNPPAPPPSVNPELAGIFTRDAEKAIGVLETILKKQGIYDDEDIQMYVINVHAIKSALANIGESELSSFALKLEEAGRKNDISVVSAETPAFMSSLREVIGKINPNKDENDNEVTDEIKGEDNEYLLEKLAFIQDACAENNKKAAKDALLQLRQKKWPHRIKNLLETIAENLLHSEFTEAAKAAGDYVNSYIVK
jgi:signal transduction histidine kinase/DNA-binding NarL/FixJ family response regulator/HPt (histidine-containing phosphotransfer) domain-containing protein